jgi:hypothetical protein
MRAWVNTVPVAMSRPLKRVIPPEPTKPETWFTRGEVAVILGCSVRTVERLENKRLHPFIDTKGVHRFNPNEVHAIHHKARGNARSIEPPKPGDIAAAVFDLLAEGKNKREIVVQLHIEPREVQRLWEEYSTGFEDAAEAKRKSEVRARYESRKQHESELAMRERVEKLKVERQRLIADGEVAKQIKASLKSIGIKPPRTRKVDSESPSEEETGPASTDD